MSKMAASNITGQTLEQDSTLNITSKQQNGQGFAKTVSGMTDQACGSQNPCDSQNPCGPLSGQSVDEQNPAPRVNQVTPNLVPLSQVCEKDKRMYQQKLHLLLHACKCQRKAHTKDETSRACDNAQCLGMRKMLHHIQVCNADACTILHCQSSKDLVLHWRYCKDSRCDLCSPFKKSSAHKQKTAMTCQENQSNEIQNHPLVKSTHLSDNNNYVIDNPGIENQQVSQKPVDVKVPVHNFKGDNSSSAKLISGAAETSEKEWYRDVTKEFRSSIIDRIIKEILSTLNREDLNDPQDPSFINVVDYATRSEQKLYEAANTKDEYYQIVAEKIYQIMRKKEQNLGSTTPSTSSLPKKLFTSSSSKTPAELNP